MRQVDARLRAQSGLMRIECDLIDSGAVARVVKVNVAGLYDASVQRNGAVAGLDVALMILAVKRCAAAAMHRVLIVDGAGFQARDRHDGLKRGSRRVLRLYRAIQQRMVRIIRNFPPV